MNIAFITPSISRKAGGIFEIERRLGQSLAEIPDTTVSVYGLQDEFAEADHAAWLPLRPKIFKVKGLRAYGYSPDLAAALRADVADVAHLHVLWMYPSAAIHQWARRTGRPYVVTPNGMLEPWALRNSAWKKRIAALLYERRMLEGAACLQANTEKEAADIRAFGLKNPIAIIPNGIDLPEMVEGSLLSVDGPDSQPSTPLSQLKHDGRRVLLYLGRLHPKKGLVNLLKAWAEVHKSKIANRKSDEWVLALAGWEQGGHEGELKQLATELGIPWADARSAPSPLRGEGGRRPDEVSVLQPSTSLLFLGPQFGDTKAACYANCDAFILPSFSEGLPMVVLEAWAYGKPVLMTPECNLPEGFAANAAIRIEQAGRDTPRAPDSAFSIEAGLAELFRAPRSALRVLGDNGRALVTQKFSWPIIAGRMHSVYQAVLHGRPLP